MTKTAGKIGRKEKLSSKSTDSVGKRKTALNLEALKRIAYHFAGAVAVGYDYNSHQSFEYEWNKWLETGKIKEWQQHESTSKEIVTANQLISTDSVGELTVSEAINIEIQENSLFIEVWINERIYHLKIPCIPKECFYAIYDRRSTMVDNGTGPTAEIIKAFNAHFTRRIST